jgi:hypothetical protein
MAKKMDNGFSLGGVLASRLGMYVMALGRPRFHHGIDRWTVCHVGDKAEGF